MDLPCSKTWPEGIESDLLKVTWLHNHSVVASNVGNHTEPGYSLNASLILNGSFPLTVRNASFGQQGVYECYVRYNDTQVHFSNVTLLIMGKDKRCLYSVSYSFSCINEFIHSFINLFIPCTPLV